MHWNGDTHIDVIDMHSALRRDLSSSQCMFQIVAVFGP